MKIFALMCSHRKKKNTEFALDYFLKGLEKDNEIVKRRLVDSNIKVCIACEYCSKNLGKCIHKDDMSEIIDEMLTSDLIIFATSLYFNSVPSLFKIMIDRTQILYNARYVIKDPIFKVRKPVVFLAVGGSRTYGNQFEGIHLETEHFLNNINGTVVDFIKFNNTDRQPVIDNEDAEKLLINKGAEIESIISNGSWK